MYLVCDGGGTKTEYLLFDPSGRVHGRGRTAGTNAIFVDPRTAAEAVCGGISDCLSQAGAKETDLEGICLFIPGFGKSADEVRKRFPHTALMVLGDEYNAYYGALGAPGGIAVLSGTGSFAVGRDAGGHWTKAGGWGPLFDDKGSGYHMGLLCLEKITRRFDQGVSHTALQRSALKQLEMPDIPSLRRGAYRPDFTRERIARLSYAVAEAGEAGDPDALEILDEASRCLAELAAVVAERMGTDCPPVSLTGGVSHMGSILTDRFEAALGQCLPRCTYQKPRFEPVVGAVLYVMYEIRNCGTLPETFLENLEKGMEKSHADG